MTKKQKILVIVGPTAVGKTALSIALAKAFNGEIISGDSMQVYKHLTIGTAKITPLEMEGITHYLVDCFDIQKSYSASEFKQLAQQYIDDICRRGKLPIIVGGTGLYIEGLLYDMTFGGQNSTDAHIRKSLQKKLEMYGQQALWNELYQLDKQAALKIPVANSRRIIRALEVIQQTGTLFSYQKEIVQPNAQHYNAKVIGLHVAREILYNRINQRVDDMVKNGLIDEAMWLLNQPNVENLQASKAIGYKELFPFLTGNSTKEESIELLKRNSRRYAKRQLTWFKNRMTVDWIDLTNTTIEEIIQEVKIWLNASF